MSDTDSKSSYPGQMTEDIARQCVAAVKDVDLAEVKIKQFVAATGSDFFKDNFSCVLNAVKIVAEVGGEGEEFHLMVKSVPGEKEKNVSTTSNVLDSEIDFYMKILPKLKAYDPELAIPNGYYGSKEEGLLIMDNLKHEGYDMWPKHEDLTEKQAMLIMRQLGRLHAATYLFLQEYDGGLEGFKANHGDMVRDLIWPQTDANVARLTGWCSAGFDNALDVARECADDPEATVAKMEAVGKERIVEETKAQMAPKQGEFLCVCHNDAWKNNFMFKNTDDAVMMFDLQIARRANPSTELNYFLASGVSPEFKLQHENGLLAEYHRALSDRLSAYGFPDTTHTVDDVRRDYMSKSTLAFVFGILHSQNHLREEDKVDLSAFVGAKPEDLPRIMADYNAEVRRKNKALPYMRRRILGIIAEADRRGVFDPRKN